MRFLQKCGHSEDKCDLQVTDGVTVKPLLDNFYDFVMSTIVLQHIAVYEIRKSILSDIYRVLVS